MKDTFRKFNESYPVSSKAGRLFFLLLFSVASVCSSPSIGYSTMLTIDPLDQEVFLGQTVAVDVAIYDIPDLTAVAGYGLTLSYDSTLLDFTGIIFNPQFESFLARNSFYEFSANQVNFWGYNPGSDEGYPNREELIALQPQDFNLATFYFETLAIGESPLTIGYMLEGLEFPGADGFPASSWIDHTVQNGEVTIIDPVPEPGTMLLFGTGILGFLGSRFRKKE